MQWICCTVLSTSYVFLPSNIRFPSLNQWAYFFEGTYVNGVVEIKYGREFMFQVLQYLGD